MRRSTLGRGQAASKTDGKVRASSHGRYLSRRGPTSAGPAHSITPCRQGVLPPRRAPTVQRSTEKFLTTHVGSLPRPDDLVRTMFAQEEGVPVDRAALQARVRT